MLHRSAGPWSGVEQILDWGKCRMGPGAGLEKCSKSLSTNISFIWDALYLRFGLWCDIYVTRIGACRAVSGRNRGLLRQWLARMATVEMETLVLVRLHQMLCTVLKKSNQCGTCGKKARSSEKLVCPRPQTLLALWGHDFTQPEFLSVVTQRSLLIFLL